MIDEFIERVKCEFNHAQIKHKPFPTCHHGYAVIKEEIDELWDEVKKQYSERRVAVIEKELIQIMAMCLRFKVDLIDKNKILND